MKSYIDMSMHYYTFSSRQPQCKRHMNCNLSGIFIFAIKSTWFMKFAAYSASRKSTHTSHCSFLCVQWKSRCVSDSCAIAPVITLIAELIWTLGVKAIGKDAIQRECESRLKNVSRWGKKEEQSRFQNWLYDCNYNHNNPDIFWIKWII